MNAVLVVAVIAAFAGGIAGNRTSWCLLASLALCLVLDLTGVAFNPIFWMLVDLVVALAIIHPGMRWRDCIVMVLFIPAWALYFAPDPLRFNGTSAIVIAQLFLTFPAIRTWNFIRTKVAKMGETNTLEMCHG